MKLLKALALTLALAVGAALVWFAGTAAWAAHRESQALGAWAALQSPLGERAPFPKKETNAAALALEKAVAPLGPKLGILGGPAAVEPEPVGMEREAKP